MHIWEIIEGPSITLTERDSIQKAREIFRETGARIIPVVDEKGWLVGYVRRVDAIKITSLKLKIPLKGFSLSAPVRDFLVTQPVATLDMDLFDVSKMMIENNIEAIPVVKSLQEHKLVGTIKITDILRTLINLGFTPKAITVSEVMTNRFYKVEPYEGINKVWHKFVKEEEKAALVVKENRVWGIITPKDFIDNRSWMFARDSEKGKVSGKVKTFMTRGVITTTQDLPIGLVANFMVEHDFTLLPVVDDEGNVLGVITQQDLLRAYIMGKKPKAKKVKQIEVPIPVEGVEYTPSENSLQTVLVKKVPAEAITPKISVKEIKQKDFVEISVDETLENALNLMLRYKVNHLVVVDNEGKIVGILSKRNIMKALGMRGPIWKRRPLERRFIEQVMTPNPPIISAYAAIEDAANQMLYLDVDAMLVEKDGTVIGILTKDDIIEAYASKAMNRAKVENIMQPCKVGIVNRHHSIVHVIRVMESNYLDAVVVAERNAPMGIISENRLVFVPVTDQIGGIKHRRIVWIRKLEGKKMARYVKITPLVAEDFMVDVPTVVKPSMDSAEVAKLLIEHNIDGLPVVDENGRVLGIITKADIIRELVRTAVAEEEYLKGHLIAKQKEKQNA